MVNICSEICRNIQLHAAISSDVLNIGRPMGNMRLADSSIRFWNVNKRTSEVGMEYLLTPK